MNPLPFHRFEFISPMRKHTALNVMRAHIEPQKFFRFRWPSSTNDKRFEGDITAEGFDVVRIIGYQNAFVPCVIGRIDDVGVGSRITVFMRPHITAILVGIAAAAFLVAMDDGSSAAIVIAMLYGLAWVGFWFEARKQEKALRQIFKETTQLVS
ncbi:MAG TPA: hypothetical protein PKY87_08535 [Terricaulis sp.]|nr:hypothetical protein [Terricaulis sp.]